MENEHDAVVIAGTICDATCRKESNVFAKWMDIGWGTLSA